MSFRDRFIAGRRPARVFGGFGDCLAGSFKKSVLAYLRPVAAFVVMGLVFIAAGSAAAETAANDLTVADALKETKVNGFVSTGYTYNFNEPHSRAVNYRPFNAKSDSFGLELAQLVFHKDASDVESTGFKLDLNFGYSVPAAIHSTGYTPSGDFDIRQAYVTYVAPVGGGLKLDAGKFVTEMGLEVIEGYEDWGANYSRSLLFYNTIPYTHTGLRGTYAFTDKLTFVGMIANGWDNVTDNNGGKTLGGHVMYMPTKDTMFNVKYCVGPEQTDNNSNLRHVVDINATTTLANKLVLKGDYVYGAEKGVPGIGNANWTGIAGVIRYPFSGKLALNLRAEFFKDSDGARTGVKQKLYEATVTPEYTVSDNMVVRAEYRHDRSDQRVFDKKDPATAKSQDTVGFNAIYHF
ncbi:MAG: porin [Deltaproteobacteria bacterium]|nr:porin [Deltaproteobacteria bacterium]